LLRDEVFVIAGFLAVLILILIFFRRKPPLKYRRVENLFTKSERKFYFILKEVLPPSYQLFAKVRAADVLLPQKSPDKSRWRSAFNRVACKHFDYVVCDEKLNIVCAIELDDASHGKKDRIERDIFINWAAKTAGFRLLRIPLQKEYDKGRLKKMILQK